MATAAVSMCKDEADVIEGFVARTAAEVDFLVIADNGSTDGTRELLDDLAGRYPLTVLDDPEVGYFQSRKVSALAARAEAAGARWIIPADSDEVWYSPFGRIADVLSDRPEAIVTAALYDHVATGADPAGDDPVVRMSWRRRAPAPLPKVACRARLPVTVHQGNHGASYDAVTVDGLLVVRHFPYRSSAQMVRKARNGAAAYAATDLPEDQGAHWRAYGRLSDEQLGDVFREHFWTADPAADPTLIFDPCPRW